MDNATIKSLKQQISVIDDKIQANQKVLANEPELTELAQEEIEQLNRQKTALQESIEQISRATHDTDDTPMGSANDAPDAIVEIRAAAGGDEAGLFAADLYRMYSLYAESNQWKVMQLSASEGGIGNLKSVTFEIKGTKANPAYSALMYESGVHRVQRIPATESSGRIHTSTATVAVLPKVSPQQINLQESDLKIETFRARGPGGQSVNTTDSAIRITHLPTNISVSIQDEKSQHKNKEKALSVLASRLYEMMRQQEKQKIDELRAEQVGSGDRSEKIRTYNFPQDRVTDHRIKKSWGNIKDIIDGNITTLLKDTHEKLSAQALKGE